VETKHPFRLFVTPSALAYALLGFVGGLLWLSLTSQPAALARPALSGLLGMSTLSASNTARPLAVPASGRVPLQEAIDSVRHLAGQPGLLLEGGLQTGDAAARAGGVYFLESVSPTRGEDFFTVDARTGEVVEATFRGRLAPTDTAARLMPADAEAQAASFARANFWGFDGLALVDQATRTGETGPVYTFKWSQIAADSHAELPVSVSVAVLGRNGQVVWYLSQRDTVQVSTEPAVAESQAVATGRAWLGPRDERWNLDQPAAVRLQVLYDDDSQQRLMWSVQFAARNEQGPRTSIRLLIDAQTGQLVQG
jgi:hypothetical protein